MNEGQYVSPWLQSISIHHSHLLYVDFTHPPTTAPPVLLPGPILRQVLLLIVNSILQAIKAYERALQLGKELKIWSIQSEAHKGSRRIHIPFNASQQWSGCTSTSAHTFVCHVHLVTDVCNGIANSPCAVCTHDMCTMTHTAHVGDSHQHWHTLGTDAL